VFLMTIDAGKIQCYCCPHILCLTRCPDAILFGPRLQVVKRLSSDYEDDPIEDCEDVRQKKADQPLSEVLYLPFVSIYNVQLLASRLKHFD
jgi:hypothetical protein